MMRVRRRQIFPAAASCKSQISIGIHRHLVRMVLLETDHGNRTHAGRPDRQASPRYPTRETTDA